MLATPMADRVLNTTFAALADPTRRAIIARLALGEASVAELAEPFAISQPAISKHLESSRAGRTDFAQPGRSTTTTPPRGQAARGSDGMAGALPRVLGRELRATRCIAQRDENKAEETEINQTIEEMTP